jgi:hypothetical protein
MMHVFTTLSAFLLAGAAAAINNSFCAPTSGDVQVVQFAYALEQMIELYFASVPINQTFLSSAPNRTNVNYAGNLQGVQLQNRLGVRAVQQLGKDVSNFSMPTCNFSFAPPSNSREFLGNAMQLEHVVSGALIGLEGYTQSPEVSFLLARLAAQHSAHAAYLGITQEAIIFPSNASSLSPSYSPEYVLSNGSNPSQLGGYLKGCVSAPRPPCGNLTVGPLIGTFNSNTSASSRTVFESASYRRSSEGTW